MATQVRTITKQSSGLDAGELLTGQSGYNWQGMAQGTTASDVQVYRAGEDGVIPAIRSVRCCSTGPTTFRIRSGVGTVEWVRRTGAGTVGFEVSFDPLVGIAGLSAVVEASLVTDYASVQVAGHDIRVV